MKNLNFVKPLKRENESLLSLNYWALQSFGMLEERYGLFSNFSYYYFLFGCFFFVPSQYYELWLIREDQEQALKNLSFTMLSSVCFVKAGTFILWRKRWMAIIDYVSSLQSQHANHDEKIDRILVKNTVYSKRITYFYWGLVCCTVLCVIFAPIVIAFAVSESRVRILQGIDPYPEIMSSWMPFEKTRGLGYFVTFGVHAAGYVWGGGLVGCYDSTAFAVMTYFVGQFEILKINCEKIFEANDASAMQRIKHCFKQHEQLIKHCEMMNSLLSPVMFLYVIVCSIMICAVAIRLTSESTSLGQQIWLAEYIIALISQLFLYCWHSTEVYYSSLQVEYGVFSSTWWKRDDELRKNVVLLHGKLRRVMTFKAGPFTNLDVTSFIAIIKCSYSYYTLLRKE